MWPLSMATKMFRKSDYLIKAFGIEKNTNDTPIAECLALIISVIIFIALYTRAIYLLRKSIKDLSEGNYFTNNVISNFKSIGYLFLICGVGEVSLKLIFGLLFGSEFSLKFDTSVVLFIIMELFFLFLSEVFAKGSSMKQENDLTI